MFDIVAEEDKPAFYKQFLGMTEMNPSLSPGHCCGVICGLRYRELAYNRYVHTFFSPDDILVKNQNRQTLVIPDMAGNLTFEWDDV